MTERVRLAVVGAGIMGANHVRVARQLHGVELVAVVDHDLDRARAAVRAGGELASNTLTDLSGAIDAAVVAVPTAYHVDTAIRLVEQQIHLLVEKPLAWSVDDARRIVEAARANGVVLAVGHIERFNAAVAELPLLLDRPIHIEASRIGPYTARVTDGVIFDLMIHDIDIVCSLAGPDAEVVRISGVARTTRGSTEDLASVTMEFSTGLTATLNSSRLGQQKIRRIEITQEESVVIADLVRQDITIHRMTHSEYLSDEGSRYRQTSVIEIPFLETRGEPLALELAHFVNCICNGNSPRVDGAAGIRAIDLAQRATEAVQTANAELR